MGSDTLALLPELLVFAGGLGALVGGSFLPRRRQWVAGVWSLVGIVAALAATAVGLSGADQTVFSGTFAVDTASGAARSIVLVAAALVVMMAMEEMRAHPRESETYALLMFAAAGVLVLAGTADLLLLVVCFLLASIPLYGLIGMARGSGSAEAVLKTYLMGALFGIVMMLGVTLVYAVAGATTYGALAAGLDRAPTAGVVAGVGLVVAGLMFEAGAVPAHFWVPDAAEGTSASAATFLTTVPKIGALVATYRLVEALPGDLGSSSLIAVLAALSMTLGNLAAYRQRDPRRLLGWSTVSQAGFLLVPVAVAGSSSSALPSLLFYAGAYALTNIGAFAITAALPARRTLTDYRGLAASNPVLTAALGVTLLGLVGTPPTAVFVGKLTVTTAAWDGGLPWLAVVVVINSVISLFYYLRWIAATLAKPPLANNPPRPTRPRPRATQVAVAAASASLILGVGAGAIWPLLNGTLAG